MQDARGRPRVSSPTDGEPRKGVACSVMPAQVALKKENERLKKESERLNKTALAQKNHSDSKSNNRMPEQEVQQQPPVSKSEQDELARYKEVYKRLKKMLENERKSGREAKASHETMLNHRTELESILRSCVDAVRKDSMKEETVSHGLSKEEREQVLEMMLSQESTIHLLYGDVASSRTTNQVTFLLPNLV
mmetsp:Transcript_41675/g.131384  ORF Transcript_41675/g.131384 Transcript_41675/m.131384 type:complete len:192 (-) Transcript_41675:159-734(-)